MDGNMECSKKIQWLCVPFRDVHKPTATFIGETVIWKKKNLKSVLILPFQIQFSHDVQNI